MAPFPKTTTTSGDKGAVPGSLARRMRELADRLVSGVSTPQPLLRMIESALADWERELGAQPAAIAPSIAASSPAEKPDAGNGGDKGEDGLIRIWSDGSCSPNPGTGGWGAIVERNGAREELSGSERESTNNIMEMTAAIEALRSTPEGASIELTTDSQYVKNGITKWIHGWKRKGWRKADGGAVLNQQLWRDMDALASARKVKWMWIKGHSGHPENERCDEMAVQARLARST